MPVRLNLVGKKFGNRVVLERIGWKDNAVFWKCKCICGTITEVRTSGLKNSTSCGCLNPRSSYDGKRHNQSGVNMTRTYMSWICMRNRCRNKNSPDYPRYGGRGIVVCKRWQNSYLDFLSDMGERPEGKTLDRINVNGNYEPKNCKWSTCKEQYHNRRKQ